jgi:hypothetical protein
MLAFERVRLGDGFDGICCSSKVVMIGFFWRSQASYSASVVPKRDTKRVIKRRSRKVTS